MKRLFLPLIFTIAIFSVADAQRPGRIIDALVFDYNWNNWMDAPDNVDIDAFRNRGINIMNLIPLTSREGRLTFATGFGISNSNIFNNVGHWSFNDQGNVLHVFPDTFEFRKNKIRLTYFEVPLQVIIRANTENTRPLRFTLGFKGGVLIDSATKFKDDDHISKLKRLDAVNNFTYGPYARIGSGRWHLFGSYDMSPVFDSPGDATRAYSIGITYSGL